MIHNLVFSVFKQPLLLRYDYNVGKGREQVAVSSSGLLDFYGVFDLFLNVMG